VSWGGIKEEGSKFMIVEVWLSVTMIWLGTNGGSLTCSKTNDEDEAKVVSICVRTSFTICFMIICSSLAGLSVVSVEGWVTRVWFSDDLLASFLKAIPKDMFEWVALRWYGWYLGWIISSVQVFVAISELGSCCWGFLK